MKVRSKLILSICIPLVITYGVMLWWDYHTQSRRSAEYVEELVLGRASLTAGILDARLAQAEQLAQTVADSMQQRDRLDQQMRNRLAAALRQYEYAAAVVIALEPSAPGRRHDIVVRRAPGGQIAVSALPAELDYTQPDAPWYYNVRQTGEPGWYSGQEIAGIFNTRTLAYSMPITFEDGFRGVVSVHLATSVFRWTRLPRGPQPPPRPQANREPATNPSASSLFDLYNDHYIIARHDGQTIYHSPERVSLPQSIDDERFGPMREVLVPAVEAARENRAQIVRARTGRTGIFTFDPGEEYFIAVVPVHRGDYLLISSFPARELLAPVNYTLLQRAALLFGGLLAIIGIVMFAAQRISRPIEELEEATEAVGRGDLSVRVPEHRRTDEIAKFSRLFNQMLTQLREQMQQIRSESEARARVESELSLARQIQTSLLPRAMPAWTPGTHFQLHAMNVPANHVAGDFYDFFTDESGRLTLVIADVAGHGVAAAIMMAVTRTLIRHLAYGGQSLATIAHRTNVALLEDSDGSMFVTLIIARYDPPTGRLHFVNAGHPPPILLRPNQSPDVLGTSTAPLLGATPFEKDEFREVCHELNPGETLVLYTDGITEARGPEGSEMLGESGLLLTVEGTETQPLEAVESKIVAAVEAHQRGPLADDVTLLLLRRI